MFRRIQLFALSSIVLALAGLSGCAANRHQATPVTSAPPKIDPVAVVADRENGITVAPVSFRTGVQERACAGSS